MSLKPNRSIIRKKKQRGRGEGKNVAGCRVVPSQKKRQSDKSVSFKGKRRGRVGLSLGHPQGEEGREEKEDEKATKAPSGSVGGKRRWGKCCKDKETRNILKALMGKRPEEGA